MTFAFDIEAAERSTLSEQVIYPSAEPQERASGDSGVFTVAMMARRQKVIAMLLANPSRQRAVYVDPDADPENIIVTVGVRHCHTFEIHVPKTKADVFKIMDVMGRQE